MGEVRRKPRRTPGSDHRGRVEGKAILSTDD
jgi:hypothetical protein